MKRPANRLRKTLRILAVLLVLAVAALQIPVVFQAALREALKLEAWRHGGSVQIGQVGGSFYQPVTLQDSIWTFHCDTGGCTQVEVGRAEAEFAWRELLPGHGPHWFKRLTLDGVKAKILVFTPETEEAAAATPVPSATEGRSAWYPRPTRVEASSVDLLFQNEDHSVELQKCRLLLSELEPGFIEVGQLKVDQAWMTHTFRNVKAATALREDGVSIANLQLDPAVNVEAFSTDFHGMMIGQPKLELSVAAFGGHIDASSDTVPADRGSTLQATVRFSQIAIAPLASFLGISEAAGGTIKDGHITFRGLPRDWLKASVTARVEATNFQWETRQWDSLKLGVSLIDRRIQIPELELHQGHNLLSLNGDMALPNGKVPWWQSEFSCNVTGRIDNLTELSALVLPEFLYAAGRIRIDGHVNGKDQRYYGALLVSGSDLSWRNAPIQDLKAGLRLNGKDLEIASLDLYNKGATKDDYLRGQGVVSLDGSGNYQGDLRASVEDLSTYAGILQKPLVPEPLAGGAVFRWSGEGTAKGQTGKFFAHLQKVRPLGDTSPLLHPLNAELEGTYAPATIHFTRLQVSDDACAFQAEAEIAARSLTLHALRLTHGQETWLQGEAVLPLDIWQAWPDAKSTPLLAPEVAGKLQLQATGLSLAEAARLTGWNWPIAGKVDGEVTAEGVLGKIAGSGHLDVAGGKFPLGGRDAELSALKGHFELAQQTVTAQGVAAHLPTGDYTAEGTLDLAAYRDPVLKAQILAPHALFALVPSLVWNGITAGSLEVPGSVRADLDLHLEASGPLSAATLQGEAWPKSLQLSGRPEISGLWRSTGPQTLPEPFGIWPAGWKLNIHCGAPASIPLEPELGTVLPDLHIAGTGAAPVLVGKLKFEQVPALGGTVPMTIEDATLTWREGFPLDPSIDLHATGLIGGFPFGAYVVGPLSHRISFVDSEAARAAILGQDKSGSAVLPTPPASSLAAASPAPASPAEPKSAAPAAKTP